MRLNACANLFSWTLPKPNRLMLFYEKNIPTPFPIPKTCLRCAWKKPFVFLQIFTNLIALRPFKKHNNNNRCLNATSRPLTQWMVVFKI